MMPVALIPLMALGDLMIFSNINTSDASGRQRLLILGYFLLGYCIVGFRWRATVAVFLAMWVHTTGAALLSMADVFLYVPFFGPLLALHAVAVRARRAAAVVAMCAATVPAFMSVWVEVENIEESRRLSALLGVGLFYLVFILGLWGIGRWARARKASVAKAAMAFERRRIAHEMHDIVANAVTIMTIQAAGARQVLRSHPEKVEEALGVIETRGESAMEELRRLLPVMHAEGVVIDRRSKSLADLDALLAEANGTDVTITQEVCGTPRPLPESAELTAYRIVQEAIVNITKHAGPGTTAVVRFTWSDVLRIEIVDDGTGTPLKNRFKISTGHGLLSLGERVKIVRGTLETGPLGKGYRVAATIPISTPDVRHTPHQRMAAPEQI